MDYWEEREQLLCNRLISLLFFLTYWIGWVLDGDWDGRRYLMDESMIPFVYLYMDEFGG